MLDFGFVFNRTIMEGGLPMRKRKKYKINCYYSNDGKILLDILAELYLEHINRKYKHK
jgi:hypothetical protein